MDWAKDKIGGRDKTPQLSDLADTLNLKDGKPHTVRAVGPARRVARHWFEVLNKEGKKARFPKLCLAYNSDSGEFDGKCPYCDIDPGTPRVEVHQNFIERKLQEDAPRKIKQPRGAEKEIVRHFGEKMFLKEGKSSESWTPVVLAGLSTSAARKIADYAEMNKRKTEDGTQTFGPNHPKYGFDVIIKFDGSRSPAEMYSVMKDENTKLTDEERRYLRWPLDLEKPDKLKDAKIEAERIAKKLAGDDEDEDGDDDDKPKKKSAKKGKSRQVDIEDDDMDDDDDTPKKKKKAKSRDEDDEDEDLEDDDDLPKKKAKSKKSRDDDDDEDEDDRPKKKAKGKKDADWDDEEDDEEDEKPRGKKKKSRDDDDDEDEDDRPKKKKKPVVDDEDEDEDEDDRPKKKKPTAKKRSRDEDDDEDDDDTPKKKKKRSSDDDDEDDDPPFKGGKKKPTSKSKKKVDDDEDDWDDEEDDDD